MGIMQVQQPDDLKQVIDRQVAEDHAAGEADFLTPAARLYADHLDAENEIGAMAERTGADLAAVRYTMAATPEESDALHRVAMARLRARLADDATGH